MFRRVWRWIVDVFHRKQVVAKPTSFSRHEGIKSHRFTLSIFGIDTVSVKSVKLPKVKPAIRKGFTPGMSHMTFEVYANVDRSVSSDLLSWIRKGDRRRADVKILTSHGQVCEQWTMTLAPVEFKNTDLDCSTSNHVMLTVITQPYSIEIRGFNVTD